MAALIAASKASEGSNFIRPGKYLFEIGDTQFGKKFKGNMWITEMAKVLEAEATDEDFQPNAVGSTCAYITNLDKAAGPGNVKAFCAAAFNVPPEEITAEVLLEVASEEQPLKYLKIRCEAYNKPIVSRPGEVFTATKWTHVPPSAADLKAAAERKAAEKAPF